MKRPIIIIVGIIIVIILIAIWIYVLFFGTPKNLNEEFSDLTFGDTTDTSIVIDNTEVEEPVVNLTSKKRLKQLTTKPVIGYQEVRKTASSTPEIYYTEAGTGHIFSIDLSSGEEKRVSGHTFPLSQKSSLTPDGKYLMIQSGSGSRSEFTVGQLSSTSDNKLITNTLDERIISFKSTNENTFLYAVQTDNSIIGKQYFPAKQKTETVFTIPFREALIDWGSNAKDTHYVYPKASSKLMGFLYEVKGTKIKRLPIDGYGLSAEGNESAVVFSKQNNGEYSSYLYHSDTKQSFQFGIDVIPEKCVFGESPSTALICAETSEVYGMDTPDSWYRGETSYADNLWETETDGQGVTYIANTLEESGQALDITNLDLSYNNQFVYFINKNNQTLWLFDRFLPLETE